MTASTCMKPIHKRASTGLAIVLCLAGTLAWSTSPVLAVDRETIVSSIDARYAEHQDIAPQIWELSELGYLEEQSTALLQQKLQEQRFSVKSGLAGIPTSFVAEAGSGQPVIAVLAEFDALPGITQTASPEREEIPGKAGGQACGHHLFGTASLGAA